MIYIMEQHEVKGKLAREFEETYRKGWGEHAKDPDMRLLWYFDVAHGAGPAYVVFTITAVPDGAAWERVLRRVLDGDLHDWSIELERCRYRLGSRLLIPAPWSLINSLDIAAVPTDESEHERAMFLIDVGHPYAPLKDYVKFQEDLWQKPEGGIIYHGMAEFTGFFTTAFGAGRRPEGVFIEKILDMNRYFDMLGNTPAMDIERRRQYMSEGLKYRDQWTSILVRTSTWSPLY